MNDYLAAIIIAKLLKDRGKKKQANILFSRSLQLSKRTLYLGWNSRIYRWDALIYSFMDEKQKAVEAIQQSVDQGYFHLTWIKDPAFTSLKDTPGYIDAAKKIETMITKQRKKLEILESNGAIPPPPPVSAPLI